MAKEQRSISNDITSDANFRTWGSTVSDLWQDVGLTKTADTGQINWTTVTRPVATGNAGYEIFTLDTDSQHANFPLYIRVDYGVFVASANVNQRISVRVGSGTDGAGTLTGVVGTQRTFSGVSIPDNSSQTHYCSAGDGYFAYAGTWVSGTTNGNALWNQIIVIERLRDNTGAPTDDGVYTFLAGQNANGATQQYGFSQITRSDDINPAYASGDTTGNSKLRIGGYVPDLSGNRGSDLYLYTHQPADYAIYNPCLSNLFYYHTDLTAGNNFTVDMYGTTRTFKALGKNTTHSFNWQNFAFGHTNSGLALRWE